MDGYIYKYIFVIFTQNMLDNICNIYILVAVEWLLVLSFQQIYKFNFILINRYDIYRFYKAKGVYTMYVHI